MFVTACTVAAVGEAVFVFVFRMSVRLDLGWGKVLNGCGLDSVSSVALGLNPVYEDGCADQSDGEGCEGHGHCRVSLVACAGFGCR